MGGLDYQMVFKGEILLHFNRFKKATIRSAFRHMLYPLNVKQIYPNHYEANICLLKTLFLMAPGIFASFPIFKS